MYSSYLGGITQDPLLMLIPVDDHLVHRGDGVFEAFRIHQGQVYDWAGHWSRLNNSAEKIELKFDFSEQQLIEILRSMYKSAPTPDAIIRFYLSRGPGGFTANPYESEKSHVHIIFTPFQPVADEKYKRGVKAKVSEVPMKQVPWHEIKSCNYLPNVLMKKEAIDSGVDFCVSVSSEGYVGEGSTENLAIYDKGELISPPFDYTLAGTTLKQVLRLAEENKSDLRLSKIHQRHISVDEVAQAEEVFLIGTTLEVLPISQWNGAVIGKGRQGPMAEKLRRLYHQDLNSNSDNLISLQEGL